MVLRLQRYQFQLVHVPGKDQNIADMLSRNPNKNCTVDTGYLNGETSVVHLMLIATPTKIKELQEATAADKELQKLKHYIRNGWPRYSNQEESRMKAYWSFRDEIHESEGLLYKGQRLIIPKSLQQDILNQLHNAHQEIVSCKNKARETVFWTTITTDIEQMVQKCSTCQSYSRANQKQPLQPHDVPQRPWEKVGVDFMHMDGKMYMVAIDYFSKYIEVIQIQSQASATVIQVLKSLFARYGIPDVLFTDNGPPFNSATFKEFCQEWQTCHETSSPTYPQSNGMVERAIQTVKGLFVKAHRNKDDHYRALLEYRATPHNGLPSPASLLMGRKIKTMLPMTDQHLKPHFRTKEHRAVMLKNQVQQKQLADKASKHLEPFKVNEPVLIFHSHRNWIPATVLKVNPDKRSYIVETSIGVQYRRNRVHLRRRGTEAAPGATKKASLIRLTTPPP